jgi:Tfp pilus assembly protein FimT
MKQKTFYMQGITTIEILIVLAVLGILFSVVTPQFSKIRENQVLKSAVQDVASSLHKARSQTLSSIDSSSYGVHLQADKVIIFKGDTFIEEDASNEEIAIIDPASISDVTLSGVSGSSGDIYFERLSGAPSESGTLTLTTGSFSKTITISATGAVSVN